MTPLFATPADAPRWQQWLLYSPPARFVIFALLAIGLMFAAGWLLRLAGLSPRSLSPATRSLLRFAIQVFGVFAAYAVVVRWIEQRRLSELSLRRAPAQATAGIAAGAILITLVVGLLAAVGAYRIEGTDPAADWVVPLLTGGVAAALSEEIIFRGALYRMSEEGLGSGWALALSSATFGGVHLMNAGSSWWSAVAIAVEAGLLLGLVYQLTRTLWVCIGLHLGWNFFQGYVWGMPVSGVREPSFIVSARPGPEWLAGDSWGVEASAAFVALNLVVAGVVFMAVRRRGLWVPLRRRAARPIIEATSPGSTPC